MKNYIIAEIGINHNGSMELAKELIMLSKESGCDAVKFQKRTPDICVPEDQKNIIRQTPWGEMKYIDYKKKLEFDENQYKELKELTDSIGIDFIVSCWDEESVDLIEKNIDVKYHKIPSALITDKSFIKKINSTGKPVILSTGMSTSEEISAAVNMLENVEYILACTSTYPTKDDEVNLNYIRTLKSEYQNLKVGYSNHSSGLVACFAAAALGTECMEFHITKDRSMYGTDQSASIDHPKKLVSGVRKIEILLGDGKKKVYESEKPIMEKLRKTNDILF